MDGYFLFVCLFAFFAKKKWSKFTVIFTLFKFDLLLK